MKVAFGSTGCPLMVSEVSRFTFWAPLLLTTSRTLAETCRVFALAP